MNDGFGDEQDSSQPPNEITGGVPELNAEQREIHQNLKNIGEGMAAFYLDGLKILPDPNLQTAASLLGHIAKEIDRGLKHLLPSKEDVNKISQMLVGKNFGFAPPRILASLNLDVDGLQSSTPLTNQDKARIENGLRERELHRPEYIASILTVLNLDIDNLPSQRIKNRVDIAIRWIDVSTRFNDFDHQHGVGKPPRHLEEFIPLWETFEGVLGNLVGSYLNFLFHVIDPILKHKVPNKEIENSLPNMVKLDPLEAGPRYQYFFEQLPHRGWLEPLSDIGYFNPKYNPPPQEIPDEPGYYRTPVWYALEYVVKVANQTKNRRSGRIVKTLVEIIDAIIKSIDDNGERIENDRTDLQTIKIMGTLFVDLLEPQHITFMGTALKSRGKSGAVDQEIGQTILPRLFEAGKQELTLKLLKIMLEVKSVDGRIQPIMDGYWLESALKEHGQALANLCGVEAAHTALAQIRVLAAADAFAFHFIQLVESDLSRLSHADYTELVVSFTSNIFQSVDPESIEETVQTLLQEPHTISKRIAVKAITDHYSHLKHLFWEWEGNPLDEIELKPEMYQLIQTNSHAFSEGEMEQILQWIESTQD
ncbi:hypothetical protein C6503_08685 [Candidatus Poribacteria bacterium]|nr:MAG: hypothetical protein C6503_08685 [Candidatus Poribacteria bacterium]